MPYVLKNKTNAQIFTAVLKNAYGLPYYGPIHWQDKTEAERNYKLSLQQLAIPEKELDCWELWQVDENQIRLFNVKLNNNPKKKLFLDDTGKSFAQ